MAGILRTRPGAHHRGPWPARGAADAPRAARLAGPRVRSRKMVDEEDAQADRDERDLSGILAGHAGAAGPRSREQAPRTRAARPTGGRADSRQPARYQRPALAEDR